MAVKPSVNMARIERNSDRMDVLLSLTSFRRVFAWFAHNKGPLETLRADHLQKLLGGNQLGVESDLDAVLFQIDVHI
jgi:hypothetical protein